MSCEEHPAYSSALKPVLIRAWKMPDGQPSKSQDVVYMPRYKKHQYTPLSGNRNKYRALDYFHLVLFKTEQHNPITFYFQRPAKVYLFVDPTDPNAAINAADTPQLDGWKSEGFAELTKGSSPLKYGIYDTVERVLPTVVYVFSKLSSGTENVVMAPSSAAIKSSVTNLTIGGKYMNFWIAESNGKASKPVGKFQGKSVAPNKKCPDALHNAWYALDDNTEDADTRGVKFATWHPRWDPCFWW